MKRSTMPMKKNEACTEQVWNKAEEAEYPSITLDIWNMKSPLLKSRYGCELDKIYPWGGGLTSLKSSTFDHAFSFAFKWAYQNHFRVNLQEAETNHVTHDFVQTPTLPIGKIYPW
jgi:hypothetical protein